MSEREELVYKIAVQHYLQGETMEAIARRFSVSRSTVSRLLKDARDLGYVHITLYPPEGSFSKLSSWFSNHYGVCTHIVPVPVGSTEKRRLDIVAAMGADIISQTVQPNDVIGIAWGNTVNTVSQHLKKQRVAGIEIVQLNGSANSTTYGIPHSSEILERFGSTFGARVHHFPVPAFFDYPETRTQLWKETSVQHIRNLHRRCTTAVFGVGALKASTPSMVYSGGFLSSADMATIRDENAVGDICTVILRADGSWDLALNERASGPTPPELQRISRRFCIAAGAGRIEAILAALRAQVATDLIIDEDTAMRLKDYAQREHV